MEIVNAIADGDSDTARKAIQMHITDAGTLALSPWADTVDEE